ncbi:MAG: hypothetical protein V2A72_02945 [Candidatus Omnitrophota bacterium]
MSIFSNPVTHEKFFGREKELAFLDKKVNDLKSGYRHNVAILGKRLIGKSSLLLDFLLSIDDPSVLPVYLDLSALTFNNFLDQFIGMLLYNNFKAQIPADTKPHLQTLIDAYGPSIPKTHKKIKVLYAHLKRQDQKQAYDDLLDLPGCLSSETGKFCVIALDNFSKLSDYAIADPYSVLGEKAMLQKMSLYILSGYQNADSMNILSEKLALLFGKFHIINLEAFSALKSLQFINSRLKHLQVPVELKQFLVYLTNGEPFYLDILTREIYAKITQSAQVVIEPENFYNIISEFIFSESSVVNQFFSILIERFFEESDAKTALKVLNAVLLNNNISDITKAAAAPKTVASKILERFTQQNLVVKNGPLFTIEDEIFKLWIKSKIIKSSARLKLTQHEYNDSFQKEVIGQIDTYNKEARKLNSNKILNLVSAFGNEKLTVGKRTHILPMFKHVNTENINQEGFFVSAHGSKLWIFSVFRKQIAEDDILDFINYCKNQKHKVSRKVLIVLNDITPEAKLLALEERMWIWSLNELNALLNLYGKPKMADL